MLHLLGPEDGSIQVNGYSDPAFVGSNVTLECSLLNHVLTGPQHSATGMEVGVLSLLTVFATSHQQWLQVRRFRDIY